MIINRDLQNLRFSNWRLGRNFLSAKWGYSLAGELDVADAQGNVGYLHTRASVMRNHLQQSAGRWFLLVREKEGAGSGDTGAPPSLGLYQLATSAGSHASAVSGSGKGEGLIRVAVLSPPPTPPSSLLDTRLDCSIALFNALNTAEGDYDAVVSIGMGDARILRARNFTAQWVTEAQYPLRATPPLIATRPISLEAAYIAPTGQLRLIAWSMRPKAGPRAAACEVYALTLTMPLQEQHQQQHMLPEPSVQAVQLLARSPLPPHSVLPNPRTDTVALGLDPSGWDSTGMAGRLGTGIPHEQQQQQQQQQQQKQQQQGGGVGFSAPPTTAPAAEEEGVEHVECRKEQPAGEMEEGDGDLDPRTLTQAAKRLARYTSENEVGPLPEQQWADLYNEGGALDMGEGTDGTAPCDFVVARVQQQQQAQQQPQQAQGSQHQQQQQGQQQQPGSQQGGAYYSEKNPTEWRVSCGPHKVLTNDTPGMLAVSDDVDACVLQFTWPEHNLMPTVKHIYTIPALAYIAAGKTQRKHVLTGVPGDEGAGIAAVLVEASKFYYVYGWVGTSEEYGVQQVVDMELQDGERVLGARLIPGFRLAGIGKPHALLVLATGRRLLLHALSGGH